MELRLPVDGRCAEKCEKGRLTCVAAAARVNGISVSCTDPFSGPIEAVHESRKLIGVS